MLVTPYTSGPDGVIPTPEQTHRNVLIPRQLLSDNDQRPVDHLALDSFQI